MSNATSFKTEIKDGQILLVIDINEYQTAKSNMLATSGGFKPAHIKHKGKDVQVSFNVRIPF